MEQDRYTLTYRAAKAHQVMDWIKAGQSGCLIGLRGAGKSNFLRFLLRNDVRQHYLGHKHSDFLFVLVNLLSLAEHAEWAIYESILDRLVDQLRLSEVEGRSVEKITSLHWDVIRSRNPLIGRRAVERCMDILCQQLAQRIVLLFDEFDTVFQTLDPSTFRCLRAIRDAHKGQVSYIVVTTNDLAHLRDDLSKVDHFYRLVSRNVCDLGLYAEVDARQMMRYLASERSTELSVGDTTSLIKLSGGHAGLLKATLSLLWNTRYGGNLEKLVPAINDEPAIQAECKKVWQSLSKSEQTALCDLVGGAQADPQTLRRLKLKGLVRESQAQFSLFSLVFEDFVHQQAPPSSIGTVISRSPRIVQIEGQHIKGLSELEFETLCYFYKRKGEVCTKDELIENVYHQQYDRRGGGIDDARLQTLISRLREKIEPNRRRPRYIITIRGEGYKFVEPGEQ